MKKKLSLLALLLMASSLWAVSFSVPLSWDNPSPNPADTQFDVSRSNSDCSAPTWTVVQANLSVLKFSDSVPPGTYCYKVTAHHVSYTSVDSNNAPFVALGSLVAPTLTIQVVVSGNGSTSATITSH